MAGRSRRRTAIAVGAGFAALAALAVTAIVLVIAGDDDGGSASSTTTPDGATTTTIGPPTPGGEDLLGLLEQGLLVDYHARYSAAGAGGIPGAEGSFVAELWRLGELYRQDSTIISNGQPQQLSIYLLADETIGCRRVGENPWNCDPVPPTSVGRVQEQIITAARQLAAVIVSVDSAEIAGQPSQCFEFDPESVESQSAGAVSSICVTDSGVPARLVSESQTLELELLELTVDDSAFVPPA